MYLLWSRLHAQAPLPPKHDPLPKVIETAAPFPLSRWRFQARRGARECQTYWLVQRFRRAPIGRLVAGGRVYACAVVDRRVLTSWAFLGFFGKNVKSVVALLHFLPIQDDVRIALDGDFDAVFAQRRVSWAHGLGGDAAAGHHQPQRNVGGEVHFVCDDLEQACDTRFDVSVKVGAHAAEVDLGAFFGDLDDELVVRFVYERARVVDPACQRRAVRWRDVADEGDAGLTQVFEAEDYF